MYKVFWWEDGPRCQDFESDKLTACLGFMEDLRRARRDGQRNLSHVTMVSENPQSVGQAGVDVTGPEYKDQWDKKHRSAGPEPGVTYRIK